MRRPYDDDVESETSYELRSQLMWVDSDTTPQFAIGTTEIHKLPSSELPSDPSLTLVPHALFLIGGDGHICDVNARAERLVGYMRDALIGEPVELVLSALRFDVHGPIAFTPISAGVCIHHRNGRAVPVEVLTCPNDGDSVVALVTPFEGGSEHSETANDQDLVQIVHDLKSPLSTIALEMTLLDDKLRDGVPTDLGSAITRVLHNIEFLDRMVQDLLDSCAADAGRFDIHRRSTELRSLIEQCVDRVITARDRDRVIIEAPAEVVLSIDDLRIERVIANLLQNALKYTRPSSGIVVKLEALADRARVSVIDRGCGLTTEETAYIFDKYRRAPRAHAHEGAGLGLYVSKLIVEAHGGTIGVDSQSGRGSRFFFEVPLG